MTRNIVRWLDRLEHKVMSSGIHHMITVTHIDWDSSLTDEGYRGSIAQWRVAKNIAEARGCPRRMIARNLSRRLERLEEKITPETVRRVWQIVFVDSDGRRREGEKIEWQAPRPVPGSRKRYR